VKNLISGKQPPGKRKIIKALRTLLEDRDFNSITTSDIAKSAGVTEGLIYKYFINKRDLLYQVLKEHMNQFLFQVENNLDDSLSSFDKLRAIIRTSIYSYDKHRVFAKMLLIEVRNSPDYFSSDACNLIRLHVKNVLEIIETGIKNHEIKKALNPLTIREVLLGAIEQSCISRIIFNRKIDVNKITDDICNIVFNGILENKQY
jgi:AcrR family transcriptional regulator